MDGLLLMDVMTVIYVWNFETRQGDFDSAISLSQNPLKLTVMKDERKRRRGKNNCQTSVTRDIDKTDGGTE